MIIRNLLGKLALCSFVGLFGAVNADNTAIINIKAQVPEDLDIQLERNNIDLFTADGSYDNQDANRTVTATNNEIKDKRLSVTLTSANDFNLKNVQAGDVNVAYSVQVGKQDEDGVTVDANRPGAVDVNTDGTHGLFFRVDLAEQEQQKVTNNKGVEFTDTLTITVANRA